RLSATPHQRKIQTVNNIATAGMVTCATDLLGIAPHNVRLAGLARDVNMVIHTCNLVWTSAALLNNGISADHHLNGVIKTGQIQLNQEVAVSHLKVLVHALYEETRTSLDSDIKLPSNCQTDGNTGV
ncbi:hypothetical protein PoB_004980800, partial [Plakobranchus ocellatus]